MSLIPSLTATSPNNFLFATLAQLQALSTSLSTINISTATGAGVSVTEVSANQWVMSNALSNAGGLSISTIPGNPSVILSNAGVTGLVAGSNVSISGATGNVTVNANLPLVQTNLASGGAPAATAVGEVTAYVGWPTQTGSSNLPVVSGGLYLLSGAYSMTTTGTTGSVELGIKNNATNLPIVTVAGSDILNTSTFFDVQFAFNAPVIPSSSTIQMYITNAGAGSGTTILNLDACFLTRVA